MKNFKKMALTGILVLFSFSSMTIKVSAAGAAALISLIPVDKIYDTVENYNRNNNTMFDINDTILFFEDNGCGQKGGNIVGSISLDKHRMTFAKEVHSFVNDEARSMLIANPGKTKISYPAVAGSVIVLYDSPSHDIKKRMKDDYTVIRIHHDLSKIIPKGKGFCVGSFERTEQTPNGTIEKIFVRQKKGSKLDGKVSTVVSIPGKKAEGWDKEKWEKTLPYDIMFFEDNNCGGGHKGHFRSRISSKVDCKKSKSCDNDEIRSLRVYRWAKPSSTIKLYDDHKGNHKDDWAVLKINKIDKRTSDGKKWGFDGPSVCIPTFEPKHDKEYKDFKKKYVHNYDGIELETHYNNGLNGKISRIVVDPHD